MRYSPFLTSNVRQVLLTGTDRMAAVQVEPPFERHLCLRAERQVVAVMDSYP
jgi:hypothetical protein